MTKIAIAEQARSIAREVASYLPDYAAQYATIARELDGKLVQKGRRYAAARLAYAAFNYSHQVIEQASGPIRFDSSASTLLTRRTLAMTAFAGTATQLQLEKQMDECCFGAELKYVQNIRYNQRTARIGSHPYSTAALILHDIAGEPVAYQKAIGYPYAYVWRDSTIQTRAGPRSLLAGSIIEPIYSQPGRGKLPPHIRFASAGLAGIAGCVADDIAFKRFGLELLPQPVRRSSLLEAVSPGAYTDRRQYVDEAIGMNSKTLGECITALIKNIPNYSPREIPS